MISFDVHFDLPDNILAEPATRTEHALANIIAKDTQPYVPFLTGSLTQRTRVDGGTVIYPGPYARRLYYGDDFKFTKSFHPLAQAHWFEVSKANNLQDWVQAEKRLMKRELG